VQTILTVILNSDLNFKLGKLDRVENLKISHQNNTRRSEKPLSLKKNLKELTNQIISVHKHNSLSFNIKGIRATKKDSAECCNA
jgi:hypothetical protein